MIDIATQRSIKKAVKNAVEEVTDFAERQRIKESIREGEMILKSGKSVTGRKMSKEELGAVQRAVDNSKRKLGLL